MMVWVFIDNLEQNYEDLSVGRTVSTEGVEGGVGVVFGIWDSTEASGVILWKASEDFYTNSIP